MKKEYSINKQKYHIHILERKQQHLSFILNGKTYAFEIHNKANYQFIVDKSRKHLGTPIHLPSRKNPHGATHFQIGPLDYLIEEVKLLVKGKDQDQGLTSPMPGKIFKILKHKGDQVKRGDTILILEAMKMEHSIKADCKGVIAELPYQEGELVPGGVHLVEIEKDEEN